MFTSNDWRQAAAGCILGLVGVFLTNGAIADDPDLIPIDVLKQHADAVTPDAVAFVSKTIQYKSVEDFGTDLKPDTDALIDYVLQEAEKLGFSGRRAADGIVGIVELGDGPVTMGVLIHLDVVPAPTDGGDHWTYPPFDGTVADGFVWGRGAQDDKGALAAALWGAKILIDNGVAFPRQLRLILGTKEEKSFESLTRYFEQEEQPEFGLVPDGVYFLEGEKGIADVHVHFDGLNPASDADGTATIVHWQGGSAINTVPDFAYMIIKADDPDALRSDIESAITDLTNDLSTVSHDGPFTGIPGLSKPYTPSLSVTDMESFVAQHPNEGTLPNGDLVISSLGVAVHGSAPWIGRNAIIETALLAERVTTLKDNAFTHAVQFVGKRLGLDYFGGSLTDDNGNGIAFAPPDGLRDPPFGLTGPQYYGTSLNLGLIGIDGDNDRVELGINFRTGLGNSNDELLTHTQSSAGDFNGSADYAPGVGSHYDPVYHPGEHPMMALVVEAYRQVYPDYPDHLPYRFFSPATTYIKLVDNHVNFGPVDLYPDPTVNRFHMADERISIDSLTQNIVLFAHAYQKMLIADPVPVLDD